MTDKSGQLTITVLVYGKVGIKSANLSSHYKFN